MKTQRFSKLKRYIDKDGNRYLYDGKFGHHYQFDHFLKDRTVSKRFTEEELLKIKLTENNN